ncbi:MAG TPA: hypothetical protein VGL99_34340 [Chloroflexota bacterium]
MHWQHLLPRAALLAALLTLMAAPAALAGGWAITTLDELPATITAGETYPVGYTILQHGVSPVTTTQSAIEITDAKGGSRERFIGTAQGPAGHYVAKVRFPRAGEWVWSVNQAPFQPQALGSIAVVLAPRPVAQVSVPAPAVGAPAPAVSVPEPAPANEAPEPARAVAPPAPATTVSAPTNTAADTSWPAPLRLGLPIGTALAVIVFAWRVLVYVRPGRATTAASRV